MSDLKLRIIEPGQAAREVSLDEGMTFGRHPDNRVVLGDPRASSRHAVVVRVDGVFHVEDAGSTNKTLIEDGPDLSKGERFELKPGVAFEIGESRIEVMGASPATSPEGNPPSGEEGSRGSTWEEARSGGVSSALEATESSVSGSSGMRTVVGEDANLSELARRESLRTTRARIVVVNEAHGEIVDVEVDDFLIGRRKKYSPHLLLDDEAVSGRHARISYDGRRFFLEDLDSTNHTYLRDERLGPRVPREIQSDTRIRFASVETLFVTDVDAQGHVIPKRSYDDALTFLERERLVTASQRAEACAMAEAEKRHPGEILLRQGHIITADQWEHAIESGRLQQIIDSRTRGAGMKTLAWVAFAFIALAVIGTLVFKEQIFG